jgi:2-oxoisovalerate ferredoxin oxidoreductase gamma subunit
MHEIKFYARGGQGAVTAAKLLVNAAILENKFAQAIPSYGQERKGAPVYAFARVHDSVIETKSYVYNPSIILVFDLGLIDLGVDIYEGLKENAVMIVNSSNTAIEADDKVKTLAIVDADQITKEELGDVPPNVAMLGALAKATDAVGIDSLEKAIKSRIRGKAGELNAKACRRAYEEVVIIKKA